VTRRYHFGLGSFRIWLVAFGLVVLIAAISAPTSPARAQRLTHLENLVKCPSCQDLSVAQSTSSSSLAIRHEIESMVARGMSDGQILTSIEAAYGPSILLSPSTAGWGALLWLAPTALFAALVVTVVVVRRRQ
jgi:cytochrome c-type biogenesis protein CcmH